VAVDGRGVLILGASGAGKSALALATITTPFQDGRRLVAAQLVSDDQVVLERRGGRLFASPPPSIAGKLEVRGLGIFDFTHLPEVEVGLVVVLKSYLEIDRLPDPSAKHTILGVDLPHVAIDPSMAGAGPRLMLAALRRPIV
jgi:serine kinase of HPr protein (carbohydrate metabolism regulator)